MLEPHNSTSLGTHNKTSDVLLATKIGIPTIRPDLLPRSHLIGRLEQATSRDVVLIRAPAGFGKTTLLASWANSTERPLAWLSLDPDDNDPGRFWRYIIAAVDRVHKGIGEQARSLLNASAHPTLKAIVTALLNELATRPIELLLVLDDYHLIEQQSDELRSFLLRTSVLEHLSGPLCDVLSGRSDGQEMLEHLERANLFLVPLDEERHWYRYHRLFADLLRARLQSADPQRMPELHRKAAAWYKEYGLVSDALRHALAAGEAVWAARLVEQHVEEVLRRGEGETLRGWLAALPQEVVRSRPRLALAQALAAFNAGRLQAAEPFLADAERALATAPNEPYEPSIGKAMSMLANVPASIALLRASLATLRGDAERTTELVRWAQAHLAEDERGPRFSVRWNLAQADWMRGRLAEAERAFAGIVAEGREAGEPHLTLTAGSVLGRIQRAQGRLEAAFRTCQEGLEFAARTGPTVVLSAAVAHVGLAEVLYERNQLDQALHHAGEGISLGQQLTSTQALATGLATMAWIRQAMRNLVGARQAMDEAHQVMLAAEVVSLFNPVPAEWARLLLAPGGVKAVARWVEERGLEVGDEPSYARELDYIVLARYLLAQNTPEKALDLLERLGTAAKAQARIGSVIQIQALQALGFQAAGKADQAMKVLAQTLLHAEPEGYIRTFVDEGKPMAALLHSALSRGVTPDYTSRLLASFPSVGRGVEASSHPVT